MLPSPGTKRATNQPRLIQNHRHERFDGHEPAEPQPWHQGLEIQKVWSSQASLVPRPDGESPLRGGFSRLLRGYGKHWFSVQAVACTKIISFPYTPSDLDPTHPKIGLNQPEIAPIRKTVRFRTDPF
jgi:hypothetical protein